MELKILKFVIKNKNKNFKHSKFFRYKFRIIDLGTLQMLMSPFRTEPEIRSKISLKHW